ncbi:MAG: carboxypeptidase-like regulatory domain-containing protein [Sphingobacteriales bacterium JAD_PAG50586_3]|nr:MAG: carboxypeptidase-like regulatory domain-containing protein [Sphingobacteriales bacterium JAD_PAG50586_3]
MRRTTTHLFFTILLICFATASYAQVISGSVKDKASGEALIGATIVVKGTGTGTAADIDGNFKFDAKATPPFTVSISFLGYKAQDITINDVTLKLNIKMEAAGVEIKGAEVIDDRIGEKARENPLTVEALDLVAIKETPSANFYDGLGQLKGVDVNSASIGFKVINTRGFNSTSPVRSLQIIDGVDNQAPGLNFSLGNFLGASELDVLKVDLVQGAAGAYYGPNAFNGVIAMTTKSPFAFPGLSVMARGAERFLFEGSVRYAQVFKNKKGDDKFAYKFNFYYLRADDWRATNYDATPQSTVGRDNPGGYDAVNRYGDEIASETSPGQSVTLPGLGTFYRRGYNEEDVVDYNTRNIKANASVHYKLNPDVELSYTSSFGTGTTVYQGRTATA